MIYFISDLHGGQDIQGLEKYASVCKEGDLLVILGDIELRFRDTEENKSFSKYFESLKCNIAFIDGNHENFDYLYGLPEEDWKGGRVHRLSDSIVHLMRGYVFDIDGHSFFTMGGCVSSQKWKDSGLWWRQETPTAEEIKRGYENLKNCGDRVDYVLTHKYCKAGTQPDPTADSYTLEGLIYYIENKVNYRHWYSGHWHKTYEPNEKHTVVFDDIIPIK